MYIVIISGDVTTITYIQKKRDICVTPAASIIINSHKSLIQPATLLLSNHLGKLRFVEVYERYMMKDFSNATKVGLIIMLIA